MTGSKTMAELVFIPSPGRGHLLANLETARLLVSRDGRLSATVLVIRESTTAHSYIPESDSRIRFVDISKPVGRHTSLAQIVDDHKDQIRKEIDRRIQDLEESECRLAGFVIDMFCTSMIDVANEFDLPTYVFFTCAASTLGLVFHFQGMRDFENQDVTVYRDMIEEKMLVPSYKAPVSMKFMPAGMLDKDGGHARLLHHAKRYREAKGIMINTFQELELHAIKSLMGDKKIPPVYPVGPILYAGEEKDSSDTMKWLDAQQDSSVVFLCFGSRGKFKEDQVRLIATALERSGHRFLWSLRMAATENPFDFPKEYDGNFEGVFPEGFLERTKGIGKVIGWAPQVPVLSHPAVGGFVTHCGWNSILESISCGVPMAAWPLYAEQQVNAFLIVDDLRVAVDIKMDYKMGSDVVVTVEEIENGIRRLMEPGSEIRANVEAMKRKSQIATTETGSSSQVVAQFIEDVMKLV